MDSRSCEGKGRRGLSVGFRRCGLQAPCGMAREFWKKKEFSLSLQIRGSRICFLSQECNEFTYEFAEETRRQSFGAVTPGYDFMARLRYIHE